jgi:hypothetical protein
VVENLILNRHFQCEKEKFGVKEKGFILDIVVTDCHSTSPFESPCIRLHWCWRRWERTVRHSVHLRLPAIHSDGGPMC